MEVTQDLSQSVEHAEALRQPLVSFENVEPCDQPPEMSTLPSLDHQQIYPPMNTPATPSLTELSGHHSSNMQKLHQ